MNKAAIVKSQKILFLCGSFYLGIYIQQGWSMEIESTGNRDRFPSTSSDEKTPSSDSEEHKSILSVEPLINEGKEKDPLKKFFVADETIGIKNLDKKKFKKARECFYFIIKDIMPSLAHLFQGELYENDLFGIGKLPEKPYQIYRKGLINTSNNFLSNTLQRAFDRVTLRYIANYYKIKLNYKIKFEIPKSSAIKPLQGREELKKLTELINNSFSYYEMFQKLESSLMKHEIAFSEFFRIINFPQYREGEAYEFIWGGLKKHFSNTFLYFQKAGDGFHEFTNPFSVDLKKLTVSKSFDVKDPLARWMENRPYIIRGFEAFDQKNYDLAFVLFFHNAKDPDNAHALDHFPQLMFGEIFENGIGFIPRSFYLAKERYGFVADTLDPRLQNLAKLGKIRARQKGQEERKGGNFESDRPASSRLKKSMDNSDYKPEFLMGFFHHLLKTYSLLEIFNILDLGGMCFLRIFSVPSFLQILILGQ